MLPRLPKAAAVLLGLAATLATPAVALAADTPEPINPGNTAWVLISSALVMLMTPGLAFFYAGMVSRKNVVSTLLQNFAALALVGLIWVFVGYSLVFTEGNSFIGGFDLFLLEGLTTEVLEGTGVPMLAFVAFQMMFAIITPALITGAIAERVHFKSWVFFLGLWSLAVYIPVAHWVWGPGGWIHAMGAIDFAGGLVVHITAGFAGLIAAMSYGKRSNKQHAVPNDVPMIMLGAALLWFGWFGFNAGSALGADGLAAHAFMTTFVGAATSFLFWMMTDWLKKGKPSATGAAIGIVVGLVTITPAAGFVTIEAAFIMCAFSAVICNIVADWFKGLSHLDDALDVFACHGIGAVIGSILTGVYATKAVNPSLEVEGILISGETELFMANLVSTFVVAGYAMIVTYGLIKLISFITPIRVSADEELSGLDAVIHGEYAKFNEKNRRVTDPVV